MILLIEDNPADVGLVREALEENGVEGEVVVLNDGEKAMKFINRVAGTSGSTPNLIILDLNLPRKPGMEVLRLIRSSAACHKTPVAILSSSALQREREEAARLGANQYIRKPSRLEEFIQLGGIFKAMLG